VSTISPEQAPAVTAFDSRERIAKRLLTSSAKASFDPLTGKKTNDLQFVKVYANSHYVTPRPTLVQAIKSIKFELKQRLDQLHDQGRLLRHDRRPILHDRPTRNHFRADPERHIHLAPRMHRPERPPPARHAGPPSRLPTANPITGPDPPGPDAEDLPPIQPPHRPGAALPAGPRPARTAVRSSPVYEEEPR